MKATVNDYATVLTSLQQQPGRDIYRDALALERVRSITIGGAVDARPWHGLPFLAEDIIEQGRHQPPHPVAGFAALMQIGADCQLNHIRVADRRMATEQISGLGKAVVQLIALLPEAPG